MKNILKRMVSFKQMPSCSYLFDYLKMHVVMIVMLCLATAIIYGIMNQSLETKVIKVNTIIWVLLFSIVAIVFSSYFAYRNYKPISKLAGKQKNEVLFCDTIKNLADVKTKYYYPIKVEQEIINNAKIGNIEKVKMLLEEVYNENTKITQLSDQISRILIYDTISTAIKIINDQKIGLAKLEDARILQQLYNSNTTNDVYNALIEIYTIICEVANVNRKSGNVDLFKGIEKYINNEYSNKNISLDLVAEEFNLSVSYLSRFFKEHSGLNFNDYLQSLRIEKAKQILLQNEKILVKDVANRVGYNNAGALIRVFKRYEDITPREYKYKSKHIEN